MKFARIALYLILTASQLPVLSVSAKTDNVRGVDKSLVALYDGAPPKKGTKKVMVLAAKLYNERARIGIYKERHKHMDNGDNVPLEVERLIVEHRYAKAHALSSDLVRLSTMFSTEQLKTENAELELANLQKQRTYGTIIAVIILLMVATLLIISSWHMHNMAKKNKELAAARDRAEESSRMKTEFMHNVSHEIRTPLNSIVGFSRLLTMKGIENTEEEKEEYFDAINKNTNLLLRIINDILNLSELKSGSGIYLEIAPCGCNETCRQAIAMSESYRQDGVEIKFQTDVDDSFTIKTDQKRLGQVLFNFLSNAYKYTTQGFVCLECSSKKRDGYITFTVADTGCGIPIEKQQSVFHEFEKNGSLVQGIGLGLKICTEIAKLLKADIGIDSEYTDGARFYFAIPLV